MLPAKACCTCNVMLEWIRCHFPEWAPGPPEWIFLKVLWMFDTTNFDIQHSYFNTGPIKEEVQGSYADRGHDNIAIEYGWNHSLSEIINALVEHGLQIEFLNEFPYSSYNVFKDMEQGK